jgi:exodeoxyribonuclease VII small subunit
MKDDMRFEEALERLREIVTRLNSGDIPLDETVKLFEEGVKLAELCRRQLEDAKLRIETLSKGMEPKKNVYRVDSSIKLD